MQHANGVIDVTAIQQMVAELPIVDKSVATAVIGIGTASGEPQAYWWSVTGEQQLNYWSYCEGKSSWVTKLDRPLCTYVTGGVHTIYEHVPNCWRQ